MGDNGLATNAKIGRPSSLYIRGNELFFHAWSTIGQGAVVDSKTYLRKIDLNTGIITTIAGTGEPNRVILVMVGRRLTQKSAMEMRHG